MVVVGLMLLVAVRQVSVLSRKVNTHYLRVLLRKQVGIVVWQMSKVLGQVSIVQVAIEVVLAVGIRSSTGMAEAVSSESRTTLSSSSKIRACVKLAYMDARWPYVGAQRGLSNR